MVDYLVEQGVTRDRMTPRGFSWTQLIVQTPPNTPNQQNRRVEIRRR